LRFELAQIYYNINIKITKLFSSFIIFYTPIYYIIDIKFTYKILHKNLLLRLHIPYAICDIL
jgi:hypothetical protein